MAFTDEDLKRLKSMPVKYGGWHQGPYCHEDIISLINRLESAERLCEATAIHFPNWYQVIDWKRESGKSGAGGGE